MATRMGKIVLSCGCVAKNYPEGVVDLVFGDYACDAVDGFHPVVTYGQYCQPCVDGLRAAGLDIFDDEAQADAWLNSAKPRVPPS